MLSWLLSLMVPPLHGEAVRRRMLRRQVVRIADVRESERQRVAGVVEASTKMYAPMTDRPCAGWFITVHETGAADARFVGILSSHGELIVRDDSGAAVVVLDGARIALGFTEQVNHANGTRSWDLWTPTERDAFERCKAKLNYPFTSGVRFFEHAIFPGQKLQVLGSANRELDHGTVDADRIGYRGDALTRPVFSNSRRSPLLLADPTWLK